MKLSKETKYGLEGLILLAKRPVGTVMLLNDIAVADDLPRFFLAKTFQKLTQHGVLRSFRGAVRGYALARPPKEIELQEILEAIEGPDVLTRCIFWSLHCSDASPCPLHHRWKDMSKRVTELLVGQTLEDLVRGGASQRRATSRATRRQPSRGRRR